MVQAASRAPAVAGMFYPSNAFALREIITQYLEAARPPALKGVRAVVAPHAGYIYSGPVAAFAYKVLAAQPVPRRIFLLGPAHRVPFLGVALGAYAELQTPLGTVRVDTSVIDQLRTRATLFSVNLLAHAPEHCLEVQLPFLQVIYNPVPPVVPLLFGEVDGLQVAEALAPLLTPEDLIIVSSDLSHYYSYAEARYLDQQLLQALLEKDMHGVLKGEACGMLPLLTLMALAERFGWRPHVLDYRNSGDTAGDRRQVVGYAAIAYTEVPHA